MTVAGSYVSSVEVRRFLGRATYLALFDEDGKGDVDDAELEACVKQAIDLGEAALNGKLARAYKGPFPIAQVPVPENLKMATLLYVKVFAYQRSPEYVKKYGESTMKAADEFSQKMCEAKELMADFLGEPFPKTVGTIVNDAGPRTIVDGTDGSYRGGDF